MLIRQATFNDLEHLLPLAHEAHDRSIFADLEMDEAIMQRHFVIAMNYDDGYAKVIERKNQVIGGLVGMISDNHFGIRCAQDLFNYSEYGTDRLLKDFMLWARVRGVRFVQITDLSNNVRYRKLCRLLDLQHAGVNYAMVV